MKIGYKLKRLRENKRKSQQEIADFLNISQRTYSNIESNKSDISCERIFELSKFLNFDYSELIQNHCHFFSLNNTHNVNEQKLKEEIILHKSRIQELKELICLLKEKVERLEKK